jgi:hypothetical protein
MAQPLYRDYSSWILAMEPRLAWVKLTRTQFRAFAAGVLGLFVFTALLLVGRMAVIKDGYEIVQLRQQRDSLVAQQKQDERRLRELQSLEHTETVARQEMGMVDVNPNQVIYLKDPSKFDMTVRAWHAIFGD